MKKRIFAAILALLMLALTACGSGTGNTPAPTPSATPAASPSAPAESRPVETPEPTPEPTPTPTPTPKPTPKPIHPAKLRVLSDEELTALKDADPETLRAQLSTLGDVIAYLDLFVTAIYTSNNRTGGWFDIPRVLFNLEDDGITIENYTTLAAYCLSDDYTDIGYVMAGLVTEDDLSGDVIPVILSALYLSTEDGYLVVTPASYSSHAGQYLQLGLTETTVSDLSALEFHLIPSQIGIGRQILDIYLAPADQANLKMAPNQTGRFEVASGTATRVYSIDAEGQAADEENRRQQRIEQAWAALDSNWNTYGLPSSQAPTMTRQEAEALYGKDLETVAAAVKTIGDCIYYFAGAGYECSGGDLQIPTSTSLVWHFNYAPRQALINNFGCCGTISGLTARLLEDDLDAVGIIGITFGLDEGGGHVISWAKNGDEYYVFDMINLISTNYQQWGFLFTSGQSIQEAAGLWSQASNWTERLMYAYQSFDGDAPVGWDWDNSNISYLPDKYKDTAIILLETPEEGYVYQWVTIDDDTWARINALRAQD